MDTKRLETEFKNLQKQLHPDLYATKSKEEQTRSESQSSLLNKAYQTLLKSNLRAKYMLNQFGYDFDEQTDYGLTPEFLYEMMEIMEIINEEDISQDVLKDIDREIDNKIKEVEGQLEVLFEKETIPEAIRATCKLNYFERVKKMIREKLDV